MSDIHSNSKANLMKCLLWVASFSISNFFISCNKPTNLTKDEVYEILNEIIADDSLRLSTICWQVDDLSISGEYGFGKEDEVFINQQKGIFKKFKIEPKRLKYYSRREKGFVFFDVDTNCNAGFVTRLSFPLISIDRQRVVIENTEDCNCMLGGQGSKDLYVKKNGRWKKEKSFDNWISRNSRTEICIIQECFKS